MQTSVLTLVRGRADHLRNLMIGLKKQTIKPDELVIAWMQSERVIDLPDIGFPVRNLHVAGDRLPLAASRNAAAQAAHGELLIFLDVDCIPEAELVKSYRNAAQQTEGLFLGEVLYLPADATSPGWTYQRLDQIGIAHPSKPTVPDEGVRPESNPAELWGLSFALPRRRYLAINGMDERFTGYGGEETDFANRLAASGLPFYWTGGARTYHQHHPVVVPPLHHFDDIVANAAYFYAKHGRWCMDYWLGQFACGGFIDWSPDAGSIRIDRCPDKADLKAAQDFGRDLLFS